MNYLITGFPGMGKSTIAKRLKERGHIAYDPQSMHGYMHTESRDSGKHIAVPEQIPRGWYDTVASYNWDLLKVEKLLEENTQNDVFICSLAHNQSALYDRFDKIFVLTLDSTDLINRLNNRWGKAIGKNSDEVADILALHEGFEKHLLNHGAVPINVARSIDEITEKILSVIERTKN